MRDDGEKTRSSEDGIKEAERGLDRREALKLGAAGLGLAVVGTAAGCTIESYARDSDLPRDLGEAPVELFSAPPMDQVRIEVLGRTPRAHQPRDLMVRLTESAGQVRAQKSSSAGECDVHRVQCTRAGKRLGHRGRPLGDCERPLCRPPGAPSSASALSG